MSKIKGYIISGICIVLAIIFIVATVIKYINNVSQKETEIASYVDGVQTTTMPSDTLRYNVTVYCNKNVIGTWKETTKTTEISNLTNNSHFKCRLDFTDSTKPTVISITPTGSNISIKMTSLSITFSEKMDTSYGSVILSPSITLSNKTWSNDNKTVTYTISNLSYAKTYTYNISEFKDTSGNIMDSISSSYTFTTEEATLANVIINQFGGRENIPEADRSSTKAMYKWRIIMEQVII